MKLKCKTGIGVWLLKDVIFKISFDLSKVHVLYSDMLKYL